VADHFDITRQAVHKHLRRLVQENAITIAGKTTGRTYKLCPTTEWMHTYSIKADLTEDSVWRTDVAPVLGAMPDNIKDIWQHGFTEMFNNAIDHSGGTAITVMISRTAAYTQMEIIDNGIGIFKKIQSALGLLDERHAVLELAKGKFTTDPTRHSGEGIFFTSRMFDGFQILSGGVFYSHHWGQEEEWILEARQERGTLVFMRLHNHTARTIRKVFDQFTSDDDDYRFNKTVVPVELAQYGDDKLVSRSQAKRLMSRVELFKIVILDFKGVASIGQAFADEIFRVFAQQHPNILLDWSHANSEVKRMIERAKSGTTAELPQANQR
jgi:anti-sigma regulatory factor (Ser/Thr protein kinase)